MSLWMPFNRWYPAYYQCKVGLEPVTKDGREEEEMQTKRRIVAINGSPHGSFGNTSQMLQMLKGHLVAEGFDFEEIFLCEQ